MTADSEGIHEIANTRDPCRKADIIFVHGLGGGSHSTWRYGKDGESDHFFWPDELGKKLTNCGVWSLGYSAGMNHWFSDEGLAIDDRAANVALKLASKEEAGFGRRPLIFITHSMGGLVVKEFVTGARSLGVQDWITVADAVKGIVFLGTPHHGSYIASIAKGFAALLRTQEHVKQMTFSGPALDKLHRAFVKWQSQSKCPVESYVETRGIARTGWLGVRRLLPSVVVVPRISGDPSLAECACYPIPADHITLVKPNGPESDVYAGVLRFVQKTLDTSSICDPSATVASATPSAQGSDVHHCNDVGIPSGDPPPSENRAQTRDYPKKNPFKGAGPLGPSSVTYVKRSCDDEYNRLLKTKVKVAICGQFQTGKTSLMLRSEQILGDAWAYIGLRDGLADLRSDNEELFVGNFFRLVSDRLGSVSDWRELRKRIEKTPTAFFLDDLSEIGREGFQSLIPRLHQLTETLSERVRVVTTSPDVEAVFRKKGLDNGKFARDWSPVIVPPFCSREAQQLLDWLPPRPKTLALGRWSVIEKLASMPGANVGLSPVLLQRLCHRL